MLERMLSSHSQVKGGAEPHLLTPLAHLGYWRNVDKAPYDHIVAALGQKTFVESLPNQGANYWHACRSYCDSLYSAYMEDEQKSVCVDKTPEYSTVWPFVTKVFPDAKYIVLTRHPGAILSSYANSFFDGDYVAAQKHEPILARYIPALAGFLRQRDVPFFHLRYEDLVSNPALWMERISRFLEIPFEAEIVEYGRRTSRPTKGGLGDPIGIGQHTRPSEIGVNKWALEFATDPVKLDLLTSVISELDPRDLECIGFPLESFWRPLDDAAGAETAPRRRMTGYRVERKLIVGGRKLVHRSQMLRSTVSWMRLACDVLLREY